jgi:hypothetical protein
MPFDKILVRMFLSGVYEKGIELYFEYFVVRDDGKQIKIALAKCKLAWIKGDDFIKLVATNLPKEIFRGLNKKS